MTTKQEREDESKAIAALARSLQFASSANARKATEDSARILDAAAQVMFGDDELTVDEVIARILKK